MPAAEVRPARAGRRRSASACAKSPWISASDRSSIETRWRIRLAHFDRTGRSALGRASSRRKQLRSRARSERARRPSESGQPQAPRAAAAAGHELEARHERGARTAPRAPLTQGLAGDREGRGSRRARPPRRRPRAPRAPRGARGRAAPGGAPVAWLASTTRGGRAPRHRAGARVSGASRAGTSQRTRSARARELARPGAGPADSSSPAAPRRRRALAGRVGEVDGERAERARARAPGRASCPARALVTTRALLAGRALNSVDLPAFTGPARTTLGGAITGASARPSAASGGQALGLLAHRARWRRVASSSRRRAPSAWSSRMRAARLARGAAPSGGRGALLERRRRRGSLRGRLGESARASARDERRAAVQVELDALRPRRQTTRPRRSRASPSARAGARAGRARRRRAAAARALRSALERPGPSTRAPRPPRGRAGERRCTRTLTAGLRARSAGRSRGPPAGRGGRARDRRRAGDARRRAGRRARARAGRRARRR